MIICSYIDDTSSIEKTKRKGGNIMPNQGERRNSGPYRISNEVMGLPGATAGTVHIISSEGAKIAGREGAKKVTG